MAYALLLLRVWFYRATFPIRYARAKWAMRRFLAPLNRQEKEARRKHGRVAEIRAAKRAAVNHALAGKANG